jgi:phage terminase small subunit
MHTTKQERFVQELIKGKSQREAYKIAYPTSKKWKETAIDSQASRLFNNSMVHARYEDLKKKTEEKVTHDAAKVRDIIIDTLLSIVTADVMNDNVDGKAVKNKHKDRFGNTVYDHYDKIEASKMLVGLLGIENTADTNGVTIRIENGQGYDE